MSSGQDLTGAVRQRMQEDGIEMSSSVDMGGTPAEGIVESQGQTAPPAGESNTDTRGTPDAIPYSRFQEVNSQLQQLRPYQELQTLGIEPDSAVRLANFEQAYMQDPRGTLAAMIDQQDLPESQKTALKTLLASQVAADAAGADGADEDGETTRLPAEVTEAVGYIRELRDKEAERDSQQRLDHVVGHWQQLDEKDGVQASVRQRLIYVQSAAGSGRQFQTLEELSEAARAMWLEDRDANLGAAVQRRASGTPFAIPSGGIPPTEPLPPPKNMSEARKRIQADIAAGRLPDLSS
jgi:hypothetical protein